MKDFLTVVIIAVVFAVLFCLVFIVPFTGINPNYSDGRRTGDIYKFSNKGMFWKSWEGEMYLGGMVSNQNGAFQMEKFFFSIAGKDEGAKKDLIEKINKCVEHRTTKCTIKYKQWFFSPMRIDSSYEVTGVEM